MKQLHDITRYLLMAMLLLAIASVNASAGQTDFCVTCSSPERSYLCRVDTPQANPGDEALRLYCIIRTAKDGGHRSCAVSRTPAKVCTGQLKTYSYNGPAIPSSMQSAIRHYRENRNKKDVREQTPAPVQISPEQKPEQKKGPPETLIEMTGRAGHAVKDATGNTGRAIGNIGKKAGKTVSNSAHGAGSAVSNAAKKTGSAVGNAARHTYDCIRTLFRDCSEKN